MGKHSIFLFVIISIFLDYNSGNFKNIINLNVILAFTPSRPRVLNLEHFAADLILNNPLDAERLELPSLPQPDKLIHMGLHADNKQAFPSLANVHKVQGNAEPAPRKLRLREHSLEHIWGD